MVIKPSSTSFALIFEKHAIKTSLLIKTAFLLDNIGVRVLDIYMTVIPGYNFVW
jgi:hypothetical protein